MVVRSIYISREAAFLATFLPVNVGNCCASIATNGKGVCGFSFRSPSECVLRLFTAIDEDEGFLRFLLAPTDCLCESVVGGAKGRVEWAGALPRVGGAGGTTSMGAAGGATSVVGVANGATSVVRVVDGVTSVVGVANGATSVVRVVDRVTSVVGVANGATSVVRVVDGVTSVVGVANGATSVVGVADGATSVVGVADGVAGGNPSVPGSVINVAESQMDLICLLNALEIDELLCCSGSDNFLLSNSLKHMTLLKSEVREVSVGKEVLVSWRSITWPSGIFVLHLVHG